MAPFISYSPAIATTTAAATATLLSSPPPLARSSSTVPLSFGLQHLYLGTGDSSSVHRRKGLPFRASAISELERSVNHLARGACRVRASEPSTAPSYRGTEESERERCSNAHGRYCTVQQLDGLRSGTLTPSRSLRGRREAAKMNTVTKMRRKRT